MKIIRIFYLKKKKKKKKKSHFGVEFSIYLNRHVFLMRTKMVCSWAELVFEPLGLYSSRK